jgi:hypothetical protein
MQREEKAVQFRQANGTGTVVPLPELPYEKTVYEGPVYPGTLT